MRRLVNMFLLIIASVLGSACSDTTGLAPVDVAQVYGEWNFVLTAEGGGGSCSSDGKVTFKANVTADGLAGNLTGRVRCNSNNGGIDEPWFESSFERAGVGGGNVQFGFTFLPFSVFRPFPYGCSVVAGGQSVGAGRLVGTVKCSGSGVSEMKGTWIANKVGSSS